MNAPTETTVNPPTRWVSRSFRWGLLTIGLGLCATALFFVKQGGEKTPTDYTTENERIESEIAELKEKALVPPIEGARTTRYVYRLYRRAALRGDLAEYAPVEKAVEEAMRLVGPTPDLCLLKAHLDFTFHRLDQTRRTLERSAGLAASPLGRILFADLDLQEGRYEEARKSYEAIVQEHPTWDVLARLAYLKGKTGAFAEADRLYREAEDEITAKEMRAFAWVKVQRGLLHFSHGRFEQALALYEEANKAFSGYWLVDAHLAELRGAQRKFDEAIKLYKSVSAGVPKPEFYQELGDLYVFMGKPDQANPWHEKALGLFLESAQRGEVHYFHHLAAFYADVREDGPEALKWARKDLALRENFATQDALAWAFYRNGQFAEATVWMTKALSSGVKDAHLFFHAGMIALASGRTEEGKQFLKEAAEINPRFQEFHVHR
jgi:tetratricopeptide (TPR) repeat protein